MSILESARIRLEPLRADHAEAMFAGLSNPRLYEFIAVDPPASLSVLREKYARLESGRSPSGDEHWLNWIVFDKPTLNARGYVQATVSGNTAAIAYVLFEDAWGQGLARESVAMTMSHVSDAYGVGRFVAMIDTCNHRSINLVEKLGFSLVKIHPAKELCHGVLTDDAEYMLIRQR